jgi:plastocyanin
MKKQYFILICFLFVAASNAQTKHTVQVSNYSFTPMNVDVAVGDTVEWQWAEGVHTTTSDDQSGPDTWDAQINSGNPNFSFVITTAGVHNYHCTYHQSLNMVGTITATVPSGVIDDQPKLSDFKLYQNFPNPFNPSTIISYSIPSASRVSLVVYNSVGEKVLELVNKNQSAGYYSIEFNSSDFHGISSGVYFYRIKAGRFDKTQKMLLMK